VLSCVQLSCANFVLLLMSFVKNYFMHYHVRGFELYIRHDLNWKYFVISYV
jgi:hypothetical protein